MKFLLVLFLIHVHAFAKLAESDNPHEDLLMNLKLLEDRCEQTKLLGASALKAGACALSFSEAARVGGEQCGKIHESFLSALPKVDRMVKDATAWKMARSSVKEAKMHASNGFDPSADPTYPFHRSNVMANFAIATSSESVAFMGTILRRLQSNKLCRSPGALMEIEKLRLEWEGDRSTESLNDYHNALGASLKRYLMDARRAFETGI